MEQGPFKPTVGVDEVEEQIRLYADCWKDFGPRFFVMPPEAIHRNYFEDIKGPCDVLLIIGKYQMHQLTYEAFRSMPMLLLDTQKYQVSHDHFYYWAFAADVYEFSREKLAPFYDMEISQRLRLLFDVIFIK